MLRNMFHTNLNSIDLQFSSKIMTDGLIGIFEDLSCFVFFLFFCLSCLNFLFSKKGKTKTCRLDQSH